MLRCWQARQARRSRHAEVVTSPRKVGGALVITINQVQLFVNENVGS